MISCHSLLVTQVSSNISNLAAKLNCLYFELFVVNFFLCHSDLHLHVFFL